MSFFFQKVIITNLKIRLFLPCIVKSFWIRRLEAHYEQTRLLYWSYKNMLCGQNGHGSQESERLQNLHVASTPNHKNNARLYQNLKRFYKITCQQYLSTVSTKLEANFKLSNSRFSSNSYNHQSLSIIIQKQYSKYNFKT